MKLREWSGLLLVLSWCNCAGPPAQTPQATPSAPQAVAPTPPATASAEPTPRAPVCLDPTPPRKPLLSEVEALERVAKDPSAPPDERARAAFDAAALYFKAEDWANAAQLFRHVALEGTSNGELHGHAITLYLEVMVMLAGQGRPCHEALRPDVQRMLARHCAEDAATLSDRCVMLRRARFGLRREEATRAVQVADASSAPADWQKAAELSRALFESECLGAPATLRLPCDEVGFNAGRVLAVSGDSVGARKVLTQLRDPKNHIDQPLVRLLECELSGKTREQCQDAQTRRQPAKASK